MSMILILILNLLMLIDYVLFQEFIIHIYYFYILFLILLFIIFMILCYLDVIVGICSIGLRIGISLVSLCVYGRVVAGSEGFRRLKLTHFLDLIARMFLYRKNC